MNEDLRYPIGKFDRASADPATRGEWMKAIANLPDAAVAAVAGLNDQQIDTPYRPGGWTVRQTVHHIADSHLNAYCRFKLALTEDSPTIRPYFEDRWAELADNDLPVDPSLKIIQGTHGHWTALLNSMSDADFARTLQHPESGEWTLDQMLGLYAWHGRHHTAHVTRLRERERW